LYSKQAVKPLDDMDPQAAGELD